MDVYEINSTSNEFIPVNVSARIVNGYTDPTVGQAYMVFRDNSLADEPATVPAGGVRTPA